MPLNYSKWDKLEVSDDSDIEGHPNVDHRSLVAWKRRDIHEKRAMRNAKIAQLKADIACNEVLLPRLRTVTEEVHGAIDGPAHFSGIVERLKTNPSPEAPAPVIPEPAFPGAPPPPPIPAKKGEKAVTYDEMILSLLMKVYEEAKEKGLTKPGGGNEQRLQETLVASLKAHTVKLGEEIERLKKELDAEEAEKAKKITSEDIHEGFESHYAPPKPEPKPVKPLKGDKNTTTEERTDIEVLNPKAVDQAHAATLASQTSPSGPPPAGKPGPTSPTKDDNEDDDDDDDDELPEMTPSLIEFSKLPLKAYEQSFHFIQEHRDVYVPGASDALLIAAFTSEREGKSKYAKQCVHQSLLIQYCEKLGPDGVRLFFKKMMAGDPRAESVFVKDVEDTYNHVRSRVEATKKELEAKEGDVEQIQLVPEGDGGQISFVIPDGPPPEHLTLEGPGTENLNIEEVRKALMMRWEVFNAFREDLKEALRSQSLDNVNKVLAKMDVSEAESVVGLLDTAGILNFADGGIRDETGRQNGGVNEDMDVEDVPGSGDEADEETDEADDDEGEAKKATKA